MPWGSSIAGNGITVLGQETFSDYPIGVGDPLNGTMSIGHAVIGAGIGFKDVPNSTVQATSIIISMVAVDVGARQELALAGQWWGFRTVNNVPGNTFRIEMQINTTFEGNYLYWMLHPARP